MDNNIDLLEKEIEELKRKNVELEEKIIRLEEKESITREVFDANVLSIYQKMARKTNAIKLFVASACCAVFLVLSKWLLITSDKLEYIILAMAFLFISVVALIVFTFIESIDTVRVVKNHIKDKRKKND